MEEFTRNKEYLDKAANVSTAIEKSSKNPQKSPPSHALINLPDQMLQSIPHKTFQTPQNIENSQCYSINYKNIPNQTQNNPPNETLENLPNQTRKNPPNQILESPPKPKTLQNLPNQTRKNPPNQTLKSPPKPRTLPRLFLSRHGTPSLKKNLGRGMVWAARKRSRRHTQGKLWTIIFRSKAALFVRFVCAFIHTFW